jgi:hypothetical protein
MGILGRLLAGKCPAPVSLERSHRPSRPRSPLLHPRWLRYPWRSLSRDDIDLLWSAKHLDFRANTARDLSEITRVVTGSPSQSIAVPSRVSPEAVQIEADAFLTVCDSVPSQLGTALDFLREGDGLRLWWFQDGLNNGHCHSLGIHADCLALEVIRGDWAHEFLIHCVITTGTVPRMIRTIEPKDPVG